MRDDKKRGVNWSSLIGWLILILVFAAGPIVSALRQAFGGTLALPSNVLSTAVLVLVVLSVLVSIGRAVGNATRGKSDSRLPTGAQPRAPVAPMPPFGGPLDPPRMPPPPQAPSPRAFTLPTNPKEVRLPPPPRFEPILTPRLVVVGVFGLIALGALALLLLGPNLP